jgi:hypothetical protein
MHGLGKPQRPTLQTYAITPTAQRETEFADAEHTSDRSAGERLLQQDYCEAPRDHELSANFPSDERLSPLKIKNVQWGRRVTREEDEFNHGYEPLQSIMSLIYRLYFPAAPGYRTFINRPDNYTMVSAAV